jgi:multidrug efflux pump subunit AcrA (membrane-fusion protein)
MDARKSEAAGMIGPALPHYAAVVNPRDAWPKLFAGCMERGAAWWNVSDVFPPRMNVPPVTSGSLGERAGASISPGGVGAQQIHARLAAFAEEGESATRALLELVRSMVDARAVALVPAGGEAQDACVVSMRGVAAAGVIAAAAKLRGAAMVVQPAAELGTDATLIGVPLVREQVERAWLVTILGVVSNRELPGIAALLQALAGFFLYREERRSGAELEQVVERMSALLELLRRVGAEEDFDKASRVAVDEVRAYLGCQRVVLGLARGGAVQVRAISGVARVDPKSPAHQPIEAAMREAMREGQRVEFHGGAAKSDGTLAHEMLALESGAARLMTLPLPAHRGAVLVEWESEPDAPGERLAAATAPFVAPLFDLLVRARPNPVLFAARRWWRDSSARRRRTTVAAAGALVLLLACPFHYRVGADCRLVPTVKRVIAAPFEGQLRKSHVQPGDHVTEGQALAEMDNRDVRLREAELLAARERSLKQRDRALSNTGEGSDFAAAQVADFEARSVAEELALVRRKIEMLEVKSPLTGVVLAGDLRRDEGRPVQQGQVLFEVAPLEEMIVEVEVPDREISRVRAGMPVTFRLEAGGRRESRIERVHPQSEPRDGRNAFVCEAPLSNDSDLRPGMRGRAKIESDRRPLAWILGHRLWEWIVTTLWW